MRAGRLVLAQPLEQPEAVEPRHVHVGNDEMHRAGRSAPSAPERRPWRSTTPCTPIWSSASMMSARLTAVSSTTMIRIFQRVDMVISFRFDVSLQDCGARCRQSTPAAPPRQFRMRLWAFRRRRRSLRSGRSCWRRPPHRQQARRAVAAHAGQDDADRVARRTSSPTESNSTSTDGRCPLTGSPLLQPASRVRAGRRPRDASAPPGAR